VPQSWLSNTPLCMVWQAYCTSLAHAPLATKAATGVVGTFLGDLIAQYSAHYAPGAGGASRAGSRAGSRPGSRAGSRRASGDGGGGGGRGVFEFDAGRCARLVAFSALIGTPLSHYWYELLDATVLPATPTAPAAVAAKVLLDQGLQTPLGMALFFGSLKVFEGRPADAVPEVKSKVGRSAGLACTALRERR
jgi:hypothetical protein